SLRSAIASLRPAQLSGMRPVSAMIARSKGFGASAPNGVSFMPGSLVLPARGRITYNASPQIRYSGLRRRGHRLHSEASGRAQGFRGFAMNYVDAATAPLRKTGQIKLHGADAFAGMRKAGRLVAECLDMLVPQIRPGVTTDQIDRTVFEFAMDH